MVEPEPEFVACMNCESLMEEGFLEALESVGKGICVFCSSYRFSYEKSFVDKCFESMVERQKTGENKIYLSGR